METQEKIFYFQNVLCIFLLIGSVSAMSTTYEDITIMGDGYYSGDLSVWDLVVRSGSSIHLAGATFSNEGMFTSVDTDWGVHVDDEPTSFLGIYAHNGTSFTEANLVLEAGNESFNSVFNILKNSPFHPFSPNDSGIINQGNHGTFVDYDSQISWWHYSSLNKDEYGNILSMDDMQKIMTLNNSGLNLYDGNLFVNGTSTANYFIGDGSLLTGIPTINDLHDTDRIESVGGDYLAITDSDLRYYDGNRNRLQLSTAFSAIVSPGSFNNILITDDNVTWNGNTLAIVDDLHDANRIVSSDTIKDLSVSNINLVYNDGSYARLYIDNVESRFTSPSGQGIFNVKNGYLNYNDGTKDRLIINDIVIALISKDGTQGLTILDAGAYYNSVEIATIDDLGDFGNVSSSVSSSVDGALARFDSTTGKIIQDSLVIVNEWGQMSGLIKLEVNDLTISSNSMYWGGTNDFYISTVEGKNLLLNGVMVTPTTREMSRIKKLTVDNIELDWSGIRNTVDGYHLYLRTTGAGDIDLNTATVDISGNITAPYFIGDGSQLTGITGSGLGDVIGDSYSVDNRIVRWNGTTGKIIKDGGSVTISDNGIVLGVAALTVDSIFLDLNQITTSGNNDLWLTTTGQGDLNLNGIEIGINQNIKNATSLEIGDLFVYGDIIESVLQDGNIELSPNGIGQVEVNSNLNINDAQLHFTTINGKATTQYFNKIGTRTGWFGYGSSSNYNWVMRNEVIGGTIDLQPDVASGNGIINNYGYTKLGPSAPAIKYKKLTGTMGATEGASISIAHGLTGAKILDISVMVESSTNYAMPSKFTNNVGFQFEYYAHGTHLVIINHPSGSEYVMGKPFRALITYEA